MRLLEIPGTPTYRRTQPRDYGAKPLERPEIVNGRQCWDEHRGQVVERRQSIHCLQLHFLDVWVCRPGTSHHFYEVLRRVELEHRKLDLGRRTLVVDLRY